MAPEDVVGILDTSSIIEIRRSIPNSLKSKVFGELTRLAEAGQLYFPREVVKELQRAVDPANPDQQFTWAKNVEKVATALDIPFDTVRQVLAQVPRVMDPDKQREDEADPYILALALKLHREDRRVVVVTEENKDTPAKMSLRTAAGVLGLPSVPLTAFLEMKNVK